jgi:hypothetical protein
MASFTSVELGWDACAFARTSVRGGEVHLSAAEVLDPAAFPGTDAFTVAVLRTRRLLRLPRQCRVVLWGLPDGATRKDAAVKPLLEPLAGAGFKVERVVSPCNALAALAARKASRGEGSMCWLAINRGGVAVVVVYPGKLIYSHSFAWDSSAGATGSQARLLQRYLLVSFLAPHVKHAMAEARKAGTPVDAVVTCGNLPDLRSLTMPLIEELDVEVETLDSLEGLVVKPQAVERLRELAPAIRVACAAAIARPTRPWDPSKKPSRWRATGVYVRAAILAIAVAGIAYMWYAKTRPSAPLPAAARSQQPRAQTPPAQLPRVPSPASKAPSSNPAAVNAPVKKPEAPPASKPIAGTAPVPVPASNSVVAATSKPPVVAPPQAPAKTPPPALPLKPATPGTDASKPVATAPVVNTPAVASNTVPRATVRPLVTMPSPNIPAPTASRGTKPVTSNPPAVSPATKAASPSPPAVTPAAKAAPSNPRAVSARPAPGPALNSPASPADKPEAGGAGSPPSAVSAAALRGPMPALLKDAVPKVTAILVERDRRFATLDGGQIVGIGDLLGRRTVVAMDERSVVLQEPSGVQIRIGLGGRLLRIERAAR